MADAAFQLSTKELSADEISDAVWLAARIAAAEPAAPAKETTQKPPSPAPRKPAPPPTTPDKTEEPPPLPDMPFFDLESFEREGAAWRREPEVKRPPQAFRLLPGLPRGLPKALRPLNRLAPLPHIFELDEEETASATAESGAWMPVHRPSEGHRFEAVLVVDQGASMQIWERTALAFRRLLERQGAFSDVKTVAVNSDDETVRSVETAPGVCRPATQLAEPTGRRIILVLTDTVGAAWRNGCLHALLRRWTHTCHVALVHVLPAERWAWAGISVESRILHDLRSTPEAIPTLSLDRRYLRAWADLVSGATNVRLAVLTSPSGEDIGDTAPVAPDVIPADERLRRFRSTATPNGLRLAGLLAAAPLTIDVMHAIHGTFLPSSAPWHMAEVLLSGLLRRRVATLNEDGSLVQYDFQPGLRRGLLASATRNETAHVQRVVEDVLGNDEPAVVGLRSALASPDSATLPVVTGRSAPVLDVQREVFSALSGPYTRRAYRLGEALSLFHPG